MSIVSPVSKLLPLRGKYSIIAKTYTCSLLGIDAILVEVEVDLASGLPGFATVGAGTRWSCRAAVPLCLFQAQ
jgi:hypothetical protein